MMKSKFKLTLQIEIDDSMTIEKIMDLLSYDDLESDKKFLELFNHSDIFRLRKMLVDQANHQINIELFHQSKI